MPCDVRWLMWFRFTKTTPKTQNQYKTKSETIHKTKPRIKPKIKPKNVIIDKMINV